MKKIVIRRSGDASSNDREVEGVNNISGDESTDGDNDNAVEDDKDGV